MGSLKSRLVAAGKKKPPAKREKGKGGLDGRNSGKSKKTNLPGD